MVFEYTGKARIFRGGLEISPLELPLLSENSLNSALKQNVIRNVKHTETEGENIEGSHAANGTRFKGKIVKVQSKRKPL